MRTKKGGWVDVYNTGRFRRVALRTSPTNTSPVKKKKKTIFDSDAIEIETHYDDDSSESERSLPSINSAQPDEEIIHGEVTPPTAKRTRLDSASETLYYLRDDESEPEESYELYESDYRLSPERVSHRSTPTNSSPVLNGSRLDSACETPCHQSNDEPDPEEWCELDDSGHRLWPARNNSSDSSTKEDETQYDEGDDDVIILEVEAGKSEEHDTRMRGTLDLECDFGTETQCQNGAVDSQEEYIRSNEVEKKGDDAGDDQVSRAARNWRS